MSDRRVLSPLGKGRCLGSSPAKRQAKRDSEGEAGRRQEGGRQTFSKEQMGSFGRLVISKSPEHLPPLLPFPKLQSGDSAKW